MYHHSKSLQGTNSLDNSAPIKLDLNTKPSSKSAIKLDLIISPLKDRNLRMKAIKNINNYSSNCTYNHHNTIEYIGVYSKPSSSCESRPSTNSSSITKYNKKDFIWILAHNSNGVITGSSVVNIKTMEKQHIAQKIKQKEDIIKLRELGWDGANGGNYHSKKLQNEASRTLQLIKVEKHISRNISPTNIKDQFDIENNDILQKAREGRIRSPEGVEQAKDILLKIKKKLNPKFKSKFFEVEKRLLDSPLIDSFHGRSNSSLSSSISSRNLNSSQLRNSLPDKMSKDKLCNQEKIIGSENIVDSDLLLLNNNEFIISNEKELAKIALDYLFQTVD